MPVTCGTCGLWTGGATPRCRVTNALTASGAACSLNPAQKLSLLKQSRLIAGDSSVGHAVQLLSINSCSPYGGHWTATYTVNGGPVQTYGGEIDDLRKARQGETAAEEVIAAMRDICIMCGAQSGAVAKTVLEGMTFWIGGGSA